MNSLNDILNLNMFIKIFPISLIGLIIIFFIFKKMLKHSSTIKVIFISIMAYFFIGFIGTAIYYISVNQYIMFNKTNYMVAGRIQSISDDSIKILSNNSTLVSGGTGIITVKLNKNTVYTLMSGSKEKKITLDELKTGFFVQVMCKEAEEFNNTVTAVKIVRKSN